MAKYLYVINYAEGEEGLCQLEMKILFEQELTGKWLISTICIEPSRSVFIKERLTIFYEGATFQEVSEQVKQQPLSYETFKILFLPFPNQSFGYHERLKRLGEIGFFVGGEADMVRPQQLLGLAELAGKWMFGELKLNDNRWVHHENKPYSYSFSLGVRVSRAIANLAVGHDLTKKIIDPCCGIGTVVLEILTVGGSVVGRDLNSKIVGKANENLKFYGHEPLISAGDIRDIKDHYDVAIIDLPYGHFSPITPETQQMILNEARRIADQLILVTQVDMKLEIVQAGFEIIEQCQVRKRNFIRYLTICR